MKSLELPVCLNRLSISFRDLSIRASVLSDDEAEVDGLDGGLIAGDLGLSSMILRPYMELAA